MGSVETVLVVGGGGREHAICWKIARDRPGIQIHAAPGNPGIASIAKCHSISALDTDALNSLAASLKVSLVIVGPETPLAAGLADKLRANGIAVFGPSAAAARIESSKSFAKELMRRGGVPTAAASVHTDIDSAKRAADALNGTAVIKASGLAAGKGVVIGATREETHAAIDSMLGKHSMGEAGAEILVEEFMDGEEISVFAVCDGRNFVLLAPSQDHKRLLEGDEGPNTGGMGAYAPVSLATDAIMARASHEVIKPILEAMRDNGTPFSGLLYAGLMLTDVGPKVVEFNCRFGDPETQVVLPLMQDDLLDLLTRASQPDGLAHASTPRFSNRAALTTIVAARGYPGTPAAGDAISLPETLSDDAMIFHAGTRVENGHLVTSGGRVFSVTGVGDSLADAQRASQSVAERIQFAGNHWRRDIGWRELQRDKR